MATHNVNDARSSVNGHSAIPNADGSITVVISRGTTAHPNSLTTLDYPRGNRRLQVAPRRRGTRPTGRAVGEGGRRPDECGLTAPTSTPWLFRRRNHSPQAELGDIRTCVTAFSSGVTCSPHRRCSRSWRGCSRSCRCSSSQARGIDRALDAGNELGQLVDATVHPALPTRVLLPRVLVGLACGAKRRSARACL